ncbi:MAG: DUF4278 domain-containing protein [Cyanobacteriota bacterium]|nr:DUF4278 domain-containing protein [Cyanobacteriota bacterium]
MELSYRGVNYSYEPTTLEVSPGKVGGRYRGLDWRFRHLQKPMVFKTNLDLKYRGVAYQANSELATTPVADVEATPVAAATSPSTKELVRSLMMGHQHAIKIRQQAMLLRAAQSVGLSSDDLADHWSRIQGKIYPTFRASYDRSHVALS